LEEFKGEAEIIYERYRARLEKLRRAAGSGG
jgi:hypothetical protein